MKEIHIFFTGSWRVLAILLALAAFSACSPEPEAAPTLAAGWVLPTVYVSPTPTPTLTPTAVVTPTPTPEPTVTPTMDPKQLLICTQVGKTWVSPLDGMTLVCVPAGKFSMGSNEGDDDEQPVHVVYLDAYWIDQTEVTNDMFAKFVASTGYRTDAEKEGWGYAYAFNNWGPVDGASWQHPTGPSSRLDGKGNQPVTLMTWNDASAYCAWAGRELPTEAQWEKAARGTDGWNFLWGNRAANKSLANFEHYAGGITPVGHYSPAGDSPYGTQDMAGNVWEWVADGYGPYPAGEQVNPSSPASGNEGVLRGGSWASSERYLRASNRTSNYLDYRRYDYGFRCALSLP